VQTGNVALPQKTKWNTYLGIHLYSRLTCAKHINAKRNQLNIKAKQMDRLLGRRSTQSAESKVLLHKAVLRPIPAYGIQLWRTASNYKIEILPRFQRHLGIYTTPGSMKISKWTQ
jgi:hypothetical protein